MPNRVAPSIPEPTPSSEALMVTVTALKEAVEMLLGQRRNSRPISAVTWQDLVDLELIESGQIPSD